MATQLKKVVAPSGGDYTSLESCMNANEQNLVTADKYFDVEISGDWSGGADTTKVTLHNYTTDATRYINIYTTGDAVHDGAWDDTAYRLKGTMSGNSDAVGISVNYITFTDFQVWHTYEGGAFRAVNVSDGKHHIVFNRCIIYAAEGAAVRNWNYTAAGYIRNSILVNGTGSTSRENTYYGIANFILQNCVIIGYLATYAVDNTYNYSFTATNVYAHAPEGTAFRKQSNGTLNTCASSDGSDSTSTVAYSTSSGAYFTNVTAGSEDFHITNTSSDLFEAGTDLSGTFTDDIDGDTRGATWDIGIDYIVGAATGVNITANVLSLTGSVQSPTVTVLKDAIITASVLSITASVQPAVASKTIIAATTAGVASLTSSVQQPTVNISKDAIITANVLSATFSVQAPSVTQGVSHNITASVLSLTASALAPTTTVYKDSSITAGVLSLASRVLSPTVSNQKDSEATPGVLSITASAQQVSVSAYKDAQISANVLAAAFSALQPEVNVYKDVQITVNVVTASFALQAPEISVVKHVDTTANVLSLTITILSPSVSEGVSGSGIANIIRLLSRIDKFVNLSSRMTKVSVRNSAVSKQNYAQSRITKYLQNQSACEKQACYQSQIDTEQ